MEKILILTFTINEDHFDQEPHLTIHACTTYDQNTKGMLIGTEIDLAVGVKNHIVSCLKRANSKNGLSKRLTASLVLHTIF